MLRRGIVSLPLGSHKAAGSCGSSGSLTKKDLGGTRGSLGRFLGLVFLSVFAVAFGVACVEFSPAEGPTTQVVAPKSTPIPTFTPPPTSVPTLTPTSTVTQTPTITPTITPTVLPGTPTVFSIAPFPPPLGLTPSTGTGTPTFPGTGTGAPPGIGGVAVPGETPSWECNGDERMIFVPESPKVGDEVLITVTSAKSHFYFLLESSASFTQVGSGKGGPGFYWQWKRKIDTAGVNQFSFFSGPAPEYLCVSGEFRATGGTPTVTPTLTITPTVTLTPTVTFTPTRTPTPTGTPRPDH